MWDPPRRSAAGSPPIGSMIMTFSMEVFGVGDGSSEADIPSHIRYKAQSAEIGKSEGFIPLATGATTGIWPRFIELWMRVLAPGASVTDGLRTCCSIRLTLLDELFCCD